MCVKFNLLMLFFICNMIMSLFQWLEGENNIILKVLCFSLKEKMIMCFRKSVLSIGPVRGSWATETFPLSWKGRRRMRVTQCVTSWSPTPGWEEIYWNTSFTQKSCVKASEVDVFPECASNLHFCIFGPVCPGWMELTRSSTYRDSYKFRESS